MRLILADDSTLLREGLARLLADEGHHVLAAVGDADALLAAVAAEPPDVAVIDVRMPPDHRDEGLRAALAIRARWPEVGVLVLSQYVERRYATELLTGAPEGVGYLLKDRVVEIEEFLDALARVADGRTAFDPEVVRQLLARGGQQRSLDALTAREREVLTEMAQGHTNAAIAARLFVSRSAVEKHVNAIFTKLGLTDTATATHSRRVLAVLRYLGA
ncbi:two component transcriptional regulator, LuxR family [Streptomyces zhaozhouensis]|uniref:Two component transcriptional regulator, LuxR family n=1 Tax=Streptomyces zhaozhouensis TaxID=1300267 RepID=A0A286DPS5_9ACTN|nr:response regulator transcription factor [Streptomyces zhaozhouensis]SOD60640.1 two component transcriptional regulator, LuxR family [Streptomyces zhaozhouensis]